MRECPYLWFVRFSVCVLRSFCYCFVLTFQHCSFIPIFFTSIVVFLPYSRCWSENECNGGKKNRSNPRVITAFIPYDHESWYVWPLSDLIVQIKTWSLLKVPVNLMLYLVIVVCLFSYIYLVVKNAYKWQYFDFIHMLEYVSYLLSSFWDGFWWRAAVHSNFEDIFEWRLFPQSKKGSIESTPFMLFPFERVNGLDTHCDTKLPHWHTREQHNGYTSFNQKQHLAC